MISIHNNVNKMYYKTIQELEIEKKNLYFYSNESKVGFTFKVFSPPLTNSILGLGTKFQGTRQLCSNVLKHVQKFPVTSTQLR